MRNKYLMQKCLDFFKGIKPKGIQSTIMLVFSFISIAVMMILGVTLYFRVSAAARQDTVASTEKLMEQTGENMEDYLMSMRQISDAVYYNVIKENDFSDKNNDIQQGMKRIYESNKRNLRSIAIYNDYGSLEGGGAGGTAKGRPERYQTGLVCAGKRGDGKYAFFYASYSKSF